MIIDIFLLKYFLLGLLLGFIAGIMYMYKIYNKNIKETDEAIAKLKKETTELYNQVVGKYRL